MVKKKRTLKRHSTYKRNKNKKKSFKQLKIKMYKGKKYNRKSIKKKLRKQKGGNLQIMQPLVQALGIVGLVGYPLYNKRWKDDENSHSTPREYKTDDKIVFIERYTRKDDNYHTENYLKSPIYNEQIDTLFLTAWTNIIVNLNSFIRIIQEKIIEDKKGGNNKNIGDYIENIEEYIVSFDLGEADKVTGKITTLRKLAAHRNRQTDGLVKSFINYIIMAIFLIYLNEKNIRGNIEYSKIFTIDKLNKVLTSFVPEFSIEETLVEILFKDSLEIIKDMDDIIETLKINEAATIISGEVVIDKLLEQKFPGVFNSKTRGSAICNKGEWPTNFYEVLIKRNMNDNKT